MKTKHRVEIGIDIPYLPISSMEEAKIIFRKYFHQSKSGKFIEDNHISYYVDYVAISLILGSTGLNAVVFLTISSEDEILLRLHSPEIFQ